MTAGQLQQFQPSHADSHNSCAEKADFSASLFVRKAFLEVPLSNCQTQWQVMSKLVIGEKFPPARLRAVSVPEDGTGRGSGWGGHGHFVSQPLPPAMQPRVHNLGHACTRCFVCPAPWKRLAVSSPCCSLAAVRGWCVPASAGPPVSLVLVSVQVLGSAVSTVLHVVGSAMSMACM